MDCGKPHCSQISQATPTTNNQQSRESPKASTAPPLSQAVVESYSYRYSLEMASPEVHHLFHHPIADHSFSADRKTLAVARDNNVELYSKSGNAFTLQDELNGHDKTVTGVDIAPSTGRIVTCSQGMLQANWL